MNMFITVIGKKNGVVFWNKVIYIFNGDNRNVDDTIREYSKVRRDVNADMQRKKIAFKDVDIFIDWEV